jgi:predicted ABC-class ATPase
VRVPNSIPPALWSPAHCREVATRDYLTRQFAQAVRSAGGDIRAGGAGSSWHSTKGGEMHVDTPGQTILERSAVLITPDFVEARFTVALPAAGRTIVSELAHAALVEMLPRYVQSSLVYSSLDQGALKRFVESVEDSCFLRASLPGLGLVAFVADGSVLPRLSGASDKPMWPADVGSCAGSGGVGGDKAVPFVSPPSMAVTVQLPNKGTVSGMGIREGVTLITGGGFHGKTTLLKAIEQGVYDHMPGDGRELVVSVASAVKIRAEDGRCVHAVDISAFITNLPYGRRTDQFVSEDASGSTSQAANIAEALEAGAK